MSTDYQHFTMRSAWFTKATKSGSQPSHLARWGSEELIRVKTRIVSPFNRNYSHPLHLLFCGTHFIGNTLCNHPILRPALTVWHRVPTPYYSDGFDAQLTHTPCKRLPELVNMSPLGILTVYGIYLRLVTRH